MDGDVKVYRSSSLPILGWTMVVLIACGGLSLVFARPRPLVLWVPVLLLVTALLAFVAYRCYVAPKVVAGPTGVEVVNPFRRRAYDWADIAAFELRPLLTVVARDGGETTAWAIQVPLRSPKRTSGESHGERIAADLNFRLEVERHERGIGA